MTPLQQEWNQERKARLVRLGFVPVPVTRRRVIVAPVVEAAPVVAVEVPEPVPKPILVIEVPRLKSVNTRAIPTPPRAEIRAKAEPGVGAIPKVKRFVCERYGFTGIDLISHRRQWPHLWVRQIAHYLAYRLTSTSFPEIGRRFGGLDHTAIMHSVRKVAALRSIDPELDAELGYLESVICK